MSCFFVGKPKWTTIFEVRRSESGEEYVGSTESEEKGWGLAKAEK